MSPMSPFHTAIELWALRGQNKEPNLPPLTLLFKVRIESRSPIHLQRLHFKRHPLFQRLNKFLGRRRRRTESGFYHIPPRNHIPGRKLLQGYPGKRSNIQGIHLDQISWPLNNVIPRLPHSIGPSTLPLRRDRPPLGLLEFSPQ